MPGDDEEISDAGAEALIEARQPYTTWRLHYGLPPSDPRAQSVTDRDVLHDLAVIRYHHQLTAMQSPTVRHVHQMRTDAKYRALWDDFEEAVRSDTGLARAVGRLGTRPEPVKPQFIRRRSAHGNE